MKKLGNLSMIVLLAEGNMYKTQKIIAKSSANYFNSNRFIVIG